VSVRVQVDASACEGHGRCFEACPELFTPDEEGFSIASTEAIESPGLHEAATRAVDGCPEGAVSLVDDAR
jgi:ferredoxin